MEEKETMQNTIWNSLQNRQIVLTGLQNQDRELFGESLGSISSQASGGFSVIDGIERMKEGDFVLVFARAAAPEKKKKASAWSAEAQDWKLAEAAWEETRILLKELETLASKKAGSILLVSGNEVYGKSYGYRSAKKEEDLGYVCHTDCMDAAAQCMRMAEHAACRLAAEKQFPVRIVRIEKNVPPEEARRLPEEALRVMLLGEIGEIYNISGKATTGAQKKEGEPEERTVLAKFSVRGVDSKIVSFQDRKEEREDRQAVEDWEKSAAYTWLRKNDPEDLEAKAQELTEYEIESGVMCCSPLSPMAVVTDTTKAEKLGK